MKKLKSALIGLIFILAGYFIGSYFPVTGFFSSGASIVGDATLQVTILRPDNSPATNLEVDAATQPGAPLKGGVAMTDSKGVATFNIKPGNYFIFFNANNFPKGLAEPINPTEVTLIENQITKRTINLTAQ